ncbi:MAG TPA: hypothetical protein DGH68_00680, partial [Bacteroidetes bacterium]|nr:hypothetical protein [Bacteroidota bacterium]
FGAGTGLTKQTSSLFVAPAGVLPSDIREDSVQIRQGFLEGSNVEGLEEMIAMIELTRNFESNQRIIQAEDGTLERANDVGRFL